MIKKSDGWGERMDNSESHNQDIIDKDLYEELSEEEMREILDEQRKERQEQEAAEEPKPKRPFPKWAFWLIAVVMVLNAGAALPQTFSIPAIDFLITSARLSADSDVQDYKEAVVVLETDDSRGTGFSISEEGLIITNYHVVEGETEVRAAYPEEGLFQAEVVETYPEIDLAVLDAGGKNLPYLAMAEQTAFSEGEHIYFIGNPLRFQGIANEGEVIGYRGLKDWNKEVLMLEAPVYRGNSGSPVINEGGEVIAVIFATLRDDEHGRVGLAVPIDYFHEMGLEESAGQ